MSFTQFVINTRLFWIHLFLQFLNQNTQLGSWRPGTREIRISSNLIKKLSLGRDFAGAET